MRFCYQDRGLLLHERRGSEQQFVGSRLIGVCTPAASAATKLQHLMPSDKGPPLFPNMLTGL